VTAVELPEKDPQHYIRQTFQPDGKNAIWKCESSQPRHVSGRLDRSHDK